MTSLKNRLYRFLRFTERYTRTDMVYLSRGGFWLGLGHAVQIGSGLILAVAFANLLPKEAYGTYQFVMAGAAIISAFTLSGMDSAVTRAIARGQEGALRYGVRTQLVWSTGITFLGAALFLYYFLNDNLTLAYAFLIAGVFAPFLEGFSLYRSYLVGTERFRESALLGMWRKPIPVVALLATLFLTDDPLVLVAVYFVSHALSAGLLYYQVVRTYHLSVSPDPEAVEYSKHLSALRIASRIASEGDKILLFHFLGAAPVAAYALALLPVTHLQNILGLMKPLTFSKFAQADFATLRATLPRKIRSFFLASFLAVAAYIVAAPYLFGLLFPAYPEAVLVSQLLALLVLGVPRSMVMQAFIAHRMTREIYLVRLTGPVVKIGLLIALLPFYGLWGVVYAVLASELYMSGLQWYLFYRSR